MSPADRSLTTIVAADDEPAILELLIQVLELVPARVIAASDGEAAFEAIQQQHPAVAVLDAEMPRRSGYEVALLVRADPALARTHLVLLTGHADAGPAATAAGFDRCLLKPIAPLELLRVVSRLLPADSDHAAGSGRT